MREFEFIGGTSKKFWKIELEGNQHTVQYGRIGTAGQSKTKDFASDAEAKQSYDKLIAEKIKEGYTDTTGGTATAAPAAAKEEAPAKAKAKKAAPTTEPASPPIVAPAALQISRELGLPAAEMARVTYRPRQPLPRPTPRAFDLEECLKRLSHVQVHYQWWQWDNVDIVPVMSREEAHFWISALGVGDGHDAVMEEVVAKLRKQTFDGKLRASDVAGLLARRSFTPARFVMRCLQNLFSPSELVQILHEEDPNTNPQQHHGWFGHLNAVHDLSANWFPYITEADLTEFRRAVRQLFDPAQAPASNAHLPFPATFYLAALLGLHQEIEGLVASWPDDRYAAAAGHSPQQAQALVFGLGSREKVAFHMKRLGLKLFNPELLLGWLAHCEYSDLEYPAESILAESQKDQCKKLMDVFTRVKAPETATPMLNLWLNSKAPAQARQWMEDNLGCAIAGLIPTAAGQGKLAEAATQFLLDQKKRGHAGFIAQCLATADPSVADKITKEVLDFEEKTYASFDDKTTPAWLRDALASAPAKSAKLPTWANPLDLPPLVVGARSLNPAQGEQVLQTLKTADFKSTPPLLKALREQGDRLALDAFAWKLFERWSQDGAPSKEKWAMAALGFLGNDRSALKITPLIRAWPGESQHQRAVFGLDCLRAIGTDTALMQLNGIAQKLKFKGLKERARQCMDRIAAERGMTKSELEDCIVPDCDLDERGNRIFDFGPRQFSFALDKDLKPMVRDEAGKLKADLPKPGAKDDAAKADAAVQDWKLLKKTLKEVLKLQTDRLEQAMVTGRRWPRDRFESLLVKHPLMTHLVRRLLWGVYDEADRLHAAFRVTEEQDYADADDAPFDLADAQTIGVVHVAHLTKEQASKWGEVFSDYEIILPFQQLGRTIFALEPGEEKAKEITRFAKLKLPALTMVGMLDRMGYQRGAPQDAGIFYEHYKSFPSPNLTACIEYDGVPIGYMEGWEDQHIKSCYFVPGAVHSRDYPDHKNALELREVHAVVMSEVLRDLHALASKGT